MANMSYCRFENTLRDLRDCYYNLNEGDLSFDEAAARKELIELCRNVVDEAEEIEEVDFDEEDFDEED